MRGVMCLPNDIYEKIESDYPIESERQLIHSLFDNLQVNEKNRVIRCILFAANKDIDRIGKLEELARSDYRDVIVVGEYDYKSGERLRDLSNPFAS